MVEDLCILFLVDTGVENGSPRTSDMDMDLWWSRSPLEAVLSLAGLLTGVLWEDRAPRGSSVVTGTTPSTGGISTKVGRRPFFSGLLSCSTISRLSELADLSLLNNDLEAPFFT